MRLNCFFALRLFLAAALLLSFRCSTGPDMAGTSSGGEGVTLAGRLVDGTGAAVAGAAVVLLRPADWDAGSIGGDTVAEDTTDRGGRYAFADVGAGTYDIPGSTPDSSLVSLVTSVDVAESDVEIPPDTMARPVSVFGTARLPLDHRMYVTLIGTPYTTVVRPDSSFVISGIEPGVYELWGIAENAHDSQRRVIVYTVDMDLRAGRDTVHDYIALRRIHTGAGPVVVGAGTSCGQRNEVEGNWWVMDDSQSGGTSTTIPDRDADVIDGSGRSGAGCAAHVSFRFGPGSRWVPYVAVGTHFGAPDRGLLATADLREADSLTFWMKGEGSRWYLRAEVLSMLSYSPDIRLKVDPIPSVWTRYTIDFENDRVGDFGSADYRNWDRLAAYSTHVLFRAVSDTVSNSGELWIDDVTLWF